MFRLHPGALQNIEVLVQHKDGAWGRVTTYTTNIIGIVVVEDLDNGTRWFWWARDIVASLKRI